MLKYIEYNWHKFTQLDGDLAANAIGEAGKIEDSFMHLPNFTLADYARLCDEALDKAKSLQDSRDKKRSTDIYEQYIRGKAHEDNN